VTFVGRRTRTHVLKLGHFANFPSGPTRSFRGGETVAVELEDTVDRYRCVDVTFNDGEFALAVPRALFRSIQKA
jgi:chitinase